MRDGNEGTKLCNQWSLVLEISLYDEREIGVYWYLFSNHCPRRCIYENVIKKKAQLLLGVLELYNSSLLLAFSCFAR